MLKILLYALIAVSSFALSLTCQSLYVSSPSSCQYLNISYPIDLPLVQSIHDDIYIIYIYKPQFDHDEPQRMHFLKFIDTWLQYHPWWKVLMELKDKILLFKINHPQLLAYLKMTALIQYPQGSCEQSQLFIRSYPYGWSEYGNEYINVMINYKENFGAIFDIYGMNITTTKRIAFLDNDYCPEIQNKWNCMFLPATNCTWPKEALKCGKLMT